MNYQDSIIKLNDHRAKIQAIRQDMRKIQEQIEPQEVPNYEFETQTGKVQLSELFGDHDDLIVILNMGNSCVYCTMWADGYNGVYPHLADRAAFVVASPDAPKSQAKFADSRGWRFPMVSHQDTSFVADMGYVSDNGGYTPGICAFQRKGGKILRVSDLAEGPGDDFCSVWHLFDLLPNGANQWQPKFKYA